MAAYYNEKDPKAAEWIRELIKAGLVADGDVDERSIEDVIPNDLRKFTQCHFFAGIAVWSYALRCAGWSDDRAVWTGSCPCQPFSAAGKGEGFADERHLWPAWFHLIDQLRPVTVFGEQVSSKDGLTWLDLVSNDLESADYSIRAVDIPACSVGATHRRNRFYFAADRLAITSTLGRRGWGHGDSTGNGGQIQVAGRGAFGDMGDPELRGTRTRDGQIASRDFGRNRPSITSESSKLAVTDSDDNRTDGRESNREAAGVPGVNRPSEPCSGKLRGASDSLRILDNTIEPGLEGFGGNGDNGNKPGRLRADEVRSATETGPANGFWRDAEWLYCTDDKYRAVEPGTFPLANGIEGRVGLLRGYGNAIVAPLATAFIESYLDLG